MMLCMEAAADARVPFVVLDRPNPIGGALVEGPRLTPGFESFGGLHDLAPRHGMTVGELARLFRAERKLDVELEIVPCEGWRRRTPFRETGLPWVFPSPNMPTPETALVYPGMCLLEGTNLSEGRGTTRPFELFGAPWLDANRLAGDLAARAAPRRPLPPGELHADLGQARGRPLPRRGAVRHRRASASGRSGPASPASCTRERRTPRGSPGAPSRTSSSPTCRRSTCSAGRRASARRSRRARRWRSSRAAFAPEERAFARRRVPYLRYEG